MKMPNMGGKETFLKLKEINPDVITVLSTGYGRNEESQEILNLGAKCLLKKPYVLDDLATKLETYMPK